jgi:hypothetical protein
MNTNTLNKTPLYHGRFSKRGANIDQPGYITKTCRKKILELLNNVKDRLEFLGKYTIDPG